MITADSSSPYKTRKELFTSRYRMSGSPPSGRSLMTTSSIGTWRGESQTIGSRAGNRYLYVCEDGLVHYCSQQRGYPAIPLEKYTRDDLEREYLTRKPCVPYSTISCVHRVAIGVFRFCARI